MRFFALLLPAVALVVVSADIVVEIPQTQTFVPYSVLSDEPVYSGDEIVKLQKALILLKGKFDYLYERIKPLAEKDIHVKAFPSTFEAQFDEVATVHHTGFPWFEVLKSVGKIGSILGSLTEVIRPYMIKQEVPVRSLNFVPYSDDAYFYDHNTMPQFYSRNYWNMYPFTKNLHSGLTRDFVTKSVPVTSTLPVVTSSIPVLTAVNDETFVTKPHTENLNSRIWGGSEEAKLKLWG